MVRSHWKFQRAPYPRPRRSASSQSPTISALARRSRSPGR
jgi:hypothetical protein